MQKAHTGALGLTCAAAYLLIVLGMPIERIVRNIFPFFCAAVFVLLIITYVPETVLALPRALGLL